MYFWRIILFVCLAWTMPASAGESQILHLDADRLSGKIDLLPHMQILIDREGLLSLDDVVGEDREDQFIAGSVTGNSFGIDQGVFWVRFTLGMEQALTEKVILHLDYPLVDEVSLFIPDGQGSFLQKSAGENYAFSQREMSHRSYLFELPPHPGNIRTYYVRVWNEGSLQIPLSLLTTKTLVEKIDRVNFALGLYYGIMALLMLSSLAFFFKFRDRLFLTYAFYLFSYLLFQLSLNGFSFQYFWPQYGWFGSLANSGSVGLVIISGLLFSGSFLQIWGPRFPVLRIAFFGLMITGAVGTIMSFFGDYATAVRISSIAGGMLPLLVMVAGIAALRQGYMPARYFLAAWSVFLIGVFVASLLYLGLLPSNFFTVYAIQIGSTFEVLTLGYALMGRINLLFEEKNRATAEAGIYLDRLNRELGELVERRTAELSEKNAHLRALVESLPDLIWLKDGHGVFSDCNSKLEQLLGKNREQIIGKTDADLFSETVAEQCRQGDAKAIKSMAPATEEREVCYASDGHQELLEIIKAPVFSEKNSLLGVLGVGRDITERRQAETALRRSEKMNAVGQLTGGIAHDFNNILGIILGNLELLEQQTGFSEQNRQRLASIRASAQRASDLTTQLLGFSRHKNTRVAACDINRLIEEMDSLTTRSLTPKVDVSYQLDEQLWQTEIDAGDFQNALLNLIINAKDAMPAGGSLIIETHNRSIDDTLVCVNSDLTSGDYILLQVSDTGHGIPVQQIERIFEPFFTLKPQGKGTGLGLAMVYGFVERSSGHIRVRSELDAGTQLEIYLPAVRQGIPEMQPAELQETERMEVESATVLVVDDEEGLRELVREYLEAVGYKVFLANEASEALSILNQEKVTLLFSDVLMPGGVDGYKLAEQAREINPDIKILLTSGYTSNQVGIESPLSEELSLLVKPYRLTDLAEKIRQVMI